MMNEIINFLNNNDCKEFAKIIFNYQEYVDVDFNSIRVILAPLDVNLKQYLPFKTSNSRQFNNLVNNHFSVEDLSPNAPSYISLSGLTLGNDINDLSIKIQAISFAKFDNVSVIIVNSVIFTPEQYKLLIAKPIPIGTYSDIGLFSTLPIDPFTIMVKQGLRGKDLLRFCRTNATINAKYCDRNDNKNVFKMILKEEFNIDTGKNDSRQVYKELIHDHPAKHLDIYKFSGEKNNLMPRDGSDPQFNIKQLAMNSNILNVISNKGKVFQLVKENPVSPSLVELTGLGGNVRKIFKGTNQFPFLMILRYNNQFDLCTSEPIGWEGLATSEKILKGTNLVTSLSNVVDFRYNIQYKQIYLLDIHSTIQLLDLARISDPVTLIAENVSRFVDGPINDINELSVNFYYLDGTIGTIIPEQFSVDLNSSPVLNIPNEKIKQIIIYKSDVAMGIISSENNNEPGRNEESVMFNTLVLTESGKLFFTYIDQKDGDFDSINELVATDKNGIRLNLKIEFGEAVPSTGNEVRFQGFDRKGHAVTFTINVGRNRRNRYIVGDTINKILLRKENRNINGYFGRRTYFYRLIYDPVITNTLELKNIRIRSTVEGSYNDLEVEVLSPPSSPDMSVSR